MQEGSGVQEVVMMIDLGGDVLYCTSVPEGWGAGCCAAEVATVFQVSDFSQSWQC